MTRPTNAEIAGLWKEALQALERVRTEDGWLCFYCERDVDGRDGHSVEHSSDCLVLRLTAAAQGMANCPDCKGLRWVLHFRDRPGSPPGNFYAPCAKCNVPPTPQQFVAAHAPTAPSCADQHHKYVGKCPYCYMPLPGIEAHGGIAHKAPSEGGSDQT